MVASSSAEKRVRATRACDFCHRRGIKCSGSCPPGSLCSSCQQYKQDQCTYDRPVRKRGPPGKNAVKSTRNGFSVPPPGADDTSSTASPSGQSDQERQVQHDHAPHQHSQTRSSSGASASRDLDHLLRMAPSPTPKMDRDAWQPQRRVPVFAVLRLLDTYHQIVYPIFPFFHWPTFIAKVQHEVHLRDRSFYATLMAACALASARLRDGAALGPPGVVAEPSDLPSPESFFEAAEDALPKNLTEATSFDDLRAAALLSITSIQFSNARKMHQYLGIYMALVAMDGLHDEARWPKTLGPIEIEERRRLVWSIYTLEIYTAVAFGGSMRSREAQISVRYPIEADDEYITTMGVVPAPPNRVIWLVGWNFTTTLYKTLEHVVDSLLDRRSSFESPVLPTTNFLEKVAEKHAELPILFKETRPFSGNPYQDRFSFQAANICVTMQSVRMVAMCGEEEIARTLNVSQVTELARPVQIAEELLEEVRRVPFAYLRAISSPLLHHLVGIYKLLFPTTERSLPKHVLLRIRQILVDMSTLLNQLDSTLTYTSDVAQRLMSQVHRMDNRMAHAELARRLDSERFELAQKRQQQDEQHHQQNLQQLQQQHQQQQTPQHHGQPLETVPSSYSSPAAGLPKTSMKSEGWAKGATMGRVTPAHNNTFSGEPSLSILSGSPNGMDWIAPFELENIFEDWPYMLFQQNSPGTALVVSEVYSAGASERNQAPSMEIEHPIREENEHLSSSARESLPAQREWSGITAAAAAAAASAVVAPTGTTAVSANTPVVW